MPWSSTVVSRRASSALNHPITLLESLLKLPLVLYKKERIRLTRVERIEAGPLASIGCVYM